MDSAGDIVIESPGEGNDLVLSGIDYVLGHDLETLTLYGSVAVYGAGNDGVNRINGNNLNNVLDGKAGADVMVGSGGNDTYLVDDIGDAVFEYLNGGADTVQSTVSYTLSDYIENLVLTGTTAINGTGNDVDNTITGNSGDNVLDGDVGADSLYGGLGNDTYIIDNAFDYVQELLNEGVDTIYSAVTHSLESTVENLTLSGTGSTIAVGNTLNNVLIGNDGDNQLSGLAGADILLAGAGNDELFIDGQDVMIRGGSGYDIAYVLGTAGVTLDLGASELEMVKGAAGNDTFTNSSVSGVAMYGGLGDDSLTGGSGADVLVGDAGVDQLHGGAGDDLLYIDGEDTIVDGGSGYDTVYVGGTGNLALGLTLDLGAANVESATGGIGNDILTMSGAGSVFLSGNQGDDVLRGGVSGDTLLGGDGNDVLDGGAGIDQLTGGLGNDTYTVDAIGDIITENVDEGMDTIQSSITYALSANVENLTLTGTAAVNGMGNALNNVLTGNSAANVLDGVVGADTMIGGAGDDTYVVDNSGDVVAENANEGIDTVQSSIGYTLGANLEYLTLTGSSAINGTGNALDNVLMGSSAANVLTGGAGNDTYVIGVGDTIVEVAGSGTDTVQSALTYTLGSNLENLTLTGSSAINGTGNSLNNVLTGNSAANVLTGGAGNDTYIVGAGDSISESNNNGTDTVQSSVTWTLGSNLENLTLIGSTVINGTGNSANNILTGNSAANVLSGANGNDTLRGGLGNDIVNGGSGNDTYLFGRGEGQDLVQDSGGSADKILYDSGINPLDLVISRQANDLRLSIHGSTDYVTVQNWHTSSSNRTETIQAGNGQTLLSTQVDQLIQAMAGFTQQTGLTWDQAIDQQPTQIQSILAASWQ